MNTNLTLPRLLPLVLLCLFAPSCPALADPSPSPTLPAVRSSLDVPAGQTLALTLTAKGVQIYECRPATGDPTKFEWALKAPEADLFDARGQKVGRHYSGPTWELADGGKVIGRLLARTNAPDNKGVPWLLLEAVSSGGGGIMGRVRSIQRIDTVGGQPPAAPATPANSGQEQRINYTATYKFYTATP